MCPTGKDVLDILKVNDSILAIFDTSYFTGYLILWRDGTRSDKGFKPFD
jgi:hypothetical protein